MLKVIGLKVYVGGTLDKIHNRTFSMQRLDYGYVDYSCIPVIRRRLASLGLIMYQRSTIWAKIKQTMASGFMSTGSVGGNYYNINTMALRNVFKGGNGIVCIHPL